MEKEFEVEVFDRLRMKEDGPYISYGQGALGGRISPDSNISRTAWVEYGGSVVGESNIMGTTYLRGDYSTIWDCDVDLMDPSGFHATNSKIKGLLNIHPDILVNIHDSNIEGCLSILASEGISTGETIECVLSNVTLRGITTIHLNDFKYRKFKISDVNFQGVNKIQLKSDELSNKVITDERD